MNKGIVITLLLVMFLVKVEAASHSFNTAVNDSKYFVLGTPEKRVPVDASKTPGTTYGNFKQSILEDIAKIQKLGKEDKAKILTQLEELAKDKDGHRIQMVCIEERVMKKGDAPIHFRYRATLDVNFRLGRTWMRLDSRNEDSDIHGSDIQGMIYGSTASERDKNAPGKTVIPKQISAGGIHPDSASFIDLHRYSWEAGGNVAVMHQLIALPVGNDYAYRFLFENERANHFPRRREIWCR